MSRKRLVWCSIRLSVPLTATSAVDTSHQFLPFRNCDKLLRPALPHARYVYFMDTDHFLFLNRCGNRRCLYVWPVGGVVHDAV